MNNVVTKIPDSIGPYRIQRLLGSGGMGIVYLGCHQETGNLAAVKTVRSMNPKRVSGIRREIRALARVQHPGVVKILDEGVESGLPWFAMEFLSGITLRKFCSEVIWSSSDVSTSRGSDFSADRDYGAFNQSSPTGWWSKIFGTTVDSLYIDELRELAGFETIQPQPDQPQTHTPLSGTSLKAILTLIVQLTGTLSYLHGEGIMHGDLKPDNVLIRSPGFPVIMDFGLTTQLWDEENREQLEQQGIRGGTVAYMAPEQILGELADSRADLYSLGCILYELLSGRVPFTGNSLAHIIKSHLETTPTPLAKLTPGIPVELDHLVMRLLAKNPQDRIGSADAVSETLIRLGADPTAIASMPRSGLHLCRPRFSGRDVEIKTFNAHLDKLESRSGNIVFLEGEGGIGKTRFLLELVRLSRIRKISVLSGCCYPLAASASSAINNGNHLEAFRKPMQTIVDGCRDRDRSEVDSIFGNRGRVLGLVFPEILQLPGQSDYADPQELPPHTARIRLFAYLSDVLEAYSRKKPLLLLIDDLHWTDDLTLGFIEFVMRIGRFRRCGILMVCAYRPEEADEHLQRLLNKPEFHKVTLKKLDEQATGTIISDMLAVSKPSPRFSEFLSRYSEGNPFFVSEYLRTAVAEGRLVRTNDGSWQIADDQAQDIANKNVCEPQMPKAILKLVERRLNGLSADAMNVASTASIIGQEFPLLILWHIIPFRDDMLDVIDELIKKQILMDTEIGHLCFTHDTIRNFIYDAMNQSTRMEIHQAIAIAYESHFGSDNPDYATTLSWHWDKCDKSRNALPYYLMTARKAVERYALREAEAAFRRYLEIADPSDSHIIPIRCEFIENVLLLQARYKDALSEAEEALDQSRIQSSVSLEADCTRLLALIHQSLGEAGKSLAFAQSALETYESLRDIKMIGLALSMLASIRFDLGELDESKRLYEKADEILKQNGDIKSRVAILGNLASIHFIHGDVTRSRDLFQKAYDISYEIRNKFTMAICLGNLANVSSYNGDLITARRQLEDALKIIREIGDRHSEGVITRNLASLLSSESNNDTARDLYYQALRIHREIDDRRMEGITLGNIGLIEWQAGSIARAEELFQQALGINREVGNVRREAEILFRLADLRRLADDDLDDAEACIDASEAIYARTGEKLGSGVCLIQRAYLALAKGSSSRPYWEAIQTCLKESQSGPKSQLQEAFENLCRSEEAFEAGQELIGGQAPETIREALRSALMKRRTQRQA